MGSLGRSSSSAAEAGSRNGSLRAAAAAAATDLRFCNGGQAPAVIETMCTLSTWLIPEDSYVEQKFAGIPALAAA